MHVLESRTRQQYVQRLELIAKQATSVVETWDGTDFTMVDLTLQAEVEILRMRLSELQINGRKP